MVCSPQSKSSFVAVLTPSAAVTSRQRPYSTRSLTRWRLWRVTPSSPWWRSTNLWLAVIIVALMPVRLQHGTVIDQLAGTATGRQHRPPCVYDIETRRVRYVSPLIDYIDALSPVLQRCVTSVCYYSFTSSRALRRFSRKGWSLFFRRRYMSVILENLYRRWPYCSLNAG